MYIAKIKKLSVLKEFNKIPYVHRYTKAKPILPPINYLILKMEL